ncbi:MAG: purine-binding chemotaxis protein CheW [Chloroflexi bacterium]|jgi:purine-binding chemotaxis protein CheW|nr:purine-binding chemotaxis protein CheW [Chloroflexota bacterium]
MQSETASIVAAAVENNQNQRENAGKYLTFKLSSEEYGLEILKVKEIIGLISITQIPRTPDHIRGVINLRGTVIPVMDLRIKFGMEAIESTSETCIIVVEVNQEEQTVRMGILVDSVSEVLDIASSEIEDTPEFGSEVNTDFIQAMGKTRDRVIMLLEINEVLSGDDITLANKTAEPSDG